jgi:toxin ParE1/3/4
VARVELAPEIVEDFDRILAHQAQYALADASARIMEIVQAIDVLAHNPLIGRPDSNGKRELVIGRGARLHGLVSVRGSNRHGVCSCRA